MTEAEVVRFTDIVGTSGKYQVMLYLFAFYSSWFLGMSTVMVELLAPKVIIYWDWDVTKNTTFSSSSCKIGDIMALNMTSNVSNSGSKLVYKSQYSTRTLTEELDLVCERSWLISLANAISTIGACVGSLLMRLSEKYGRKPFIILVAIVSVFLSLCLDFTKEYALFAVCNFLFRACTTQAYILLFIQALELTTPSQTPYIGVFMKSGVLVGQTVLVCAAWVLKNWFHTQLFQTLIMIGFLPASWLLQESPVWLAVRGRYDESRKVLEKIIKWNGRRLQEVEPKIDLWLSHMKTRCEFETTAEKGKLRDLFKNRRITLYIFALSFFQFTTIFIYNGLAMNAESFGSGLYVELTLSNAASLFSVLVAGLLLKKASVRLMLAVTYLLEGLTCIVYTLTCTSPLARTVNSILGRLFISPIYALGRIYCNEVLPTSVRGVGNGFAAFFAFLLSSTSPFTKELAEETFLFVPFILFAVFSLTSSFLYVLMPETKGKPMYHTVHELNKFVRMKSPEEDPKRTVYTITTHL